MPALTGDVRVYTPKKIEAKMIRFLILATIIFCFNSSAYSAENPTGEKTNTTKETPQKKTDKPEKITTQLTPLSESPISSVKTTVQTGHTENQEKKEAKSPKESWWIKLMGDPVAFFTCLLVAVTGLLWWSTRKLVLGSERTAEQQLRAYVFTKHDEPLAENSEECLAAPIVIKNFGQTPAIDLISNLEIGFYRYPLDTKLELSPRLTKPSKSPLAPGEQVRQFAILPCPLNQAEKEAIISEKGAIFVHGELVYTDIFKKTRTTRVCLYSTGDDFRSGMLAYYHEGNNSD